jgi:peptidyl-prolyl cis-trans isomerase B (cyclophilin B)
MRQVDLETTAGTIRVELDDAKAPETVKNFINNVENGHYDNTVFHRVIKGFMVQGGGFEPGMSQKPDRPGDPERGEQRPAQRPLHDRDGAHVGTALGDGAVLHQRRRQRVPELQVGDRARLGLRGVRPSREGAGGRRRDRAVRTGNRAGHSDVPIDDVTITRATVVA